MIMIETSAMPVHRPEAGSDVQNGTTNLGREFAIVAVTTAVFMLVRGYGFGIDDHAIHLAFIERAKDPGFLPGDPMLAMAPKHPSAFFSLIAALSAWVSIETIYFAGYLLSTFAMLFALRMLAHSLWPGRGAEWVAMFALAGALVQRSVAGGIDNFDTLFLPRVLSLGPLLLALALCVRGKSLWAFALTGIVFLFHATTAAHTAVLLWMACLFCGRERIRALLFGPGVFLLAASPLLVAMAMAGGSGVPTPAPAAWIDAVKLHYPRHHFEAPFIFAMHALCGSFAVLTGILSSPWKGAGRLLAGFLAGVLLLFAAGLVGNNLLYSPYTIQLHVFQAGRMLDYLALVSLGWWTFTCFRHSMVIGSLSLIPGAAYVFSTQLSYLYPIGGLPASVHYVLVMSLILLLIVAGVLMTLALRFTRKAATTDRTIGDGDGDLIAVAPDGRRPSPRLTIVLAASLFAIVTMTAGSIARWDFAGTGLAGYRMMRWADAELPADAVVVVPPYLTQPIVAFRYFGRRRIVGSWKDGGEGTFDHAFQMYWAEYMQDIFQLQVSVKANDYGRLLRRVNHDYETMHAEDFRAIAGKYAATHVIRVAVSAPLPFPELYRDDDYVLYRIEGAQEANGSRAIATAPVIEIGATKPRR
jgi:hypothetical protein